MLRFYAERLHTLPVHPFPLFFSAFRQLSYQRPIMAEALPPLSREDRDTYGRMGTTMEWFHNNFRNTWKVLYGACSSGKRPANMSIRQFLNNGSEFAHHLTMHHTIGIAPVLVFPFAFTYSRNCRGATHFPRSCAENAGIQERITAPHSAQADTQRARSIRGIHRRLQDWKT